MTKLNQEKTVRLQHAEAMEAARFQREAIVWGLIKEAIVKTLPLGGVLEIAEKTGMTPWQVQRCVQAFEARGELKTETKGPKRRYGVNGLWSEWSTPTHIRLMNFDNGKRAKRKGPCISRIAESCTGVAPDYPVVRICAKCRRIGEGLAFVEAGSSGGRAGLSRSSAAKGI